MMKYKIGLILLLFLVFVACGKEKNPTSSPASFEYESFHSGCKGTSGTEKLTISSSNDSIQVVHLNAHYNSCAEIKVEVKKTDYGFDLFEKDEGTTCEGTCDSDVTTIIHKLSGGTYLIRVFDTGRNSVGQGYVEVQPRDDGGPQG